MMMINEVDLIMTNPNKSKHTVHHERSVDFMDTTASIPEHVESSTDEVDFVHVQPSTQIALGMGGKSIENSAVDYSRIGTKHQSAGSWNGGQLRSILKSDGEQRKSVDTVTIANDDGDGGNGDSNTKMQKYHLQQYQPQQSDLVNNKASITSTIERKLPFPFHRKRSDPTGQQTNAGKERPKFVKCASIARLFGNTYSTQQTPATPAKNPDASGKAKEQDVKPSAITINSAGIKMERFRKCPENNVENGEFDYLPNQNCFQVKDNCDDKDLGARALKTISRSLGRLWRRSHSVEISIPDPEYKVLYLGNVLTGWAKGESCIEKPLATLWRNYTQNNKPDVVMRILVCSSGLKATTRQHGLTEYWSNRVTHCSSPKSYPRLFCWIYRHEGRKLKHELRCHAVLCPKESISEQMCQTLKENLSQALQEFKRDKVMRQNARLSLVNSVYENPSMPRRKILLSVGANNYRPPMERSKSAPKLMAIEEAIGEEDEEVATGEEARRSCCKVDPIFPAMTLGRRHCRRGHSIRRSRPSITGADGVMKHIGVGVMKNGVGGAMKHGGIGVLPRERSRSVSFNDFNNTIIIDNAIYKRNSIESEPKSESHTKQINSDVQQQQHKLENDIKSAVVEQTPLITGHTDVDDESDEDFNSLLMINQYDCKSSLSGELLSYFDSKIKMKSATSLCDLSPLQYDDEVCMATNLALLGQRASVSLDDLDLLGDDDDDDEDRCIHADRRDMNENNNDKDAFYNQESIIDCLVNASQISRSNSEQITDESTSPNEFNDNDCFGEGSLTLNNSFCKNDSLPMLRRGSSGIGQNAVFKRACGMMPGPDSDEGSISSGCETASNATANNGDALDKDAGPHHQLSSDATILTLFAQKNGRPATIKRVDSQNRNHLFLNDDINGDNITINRIMGANGNAGSHVKHSNGNHDDDCDSEYSDESGFVEYQNITGGQMGGHINVIAIDGTEEILNLNSKNDTNNNLASEVSNDFGGDKVPTRLMINIPKNAKSILI